VLLFVADAIATLVDCTSLLTFSLQLPSKALHAQPAFALCHPVRIALRLNDRNSA
jgi:hypothetical protein